MRSCKMCAPPPTNKVVCLYIHAGQLHYSAEMQKGAEG